MRRLIVALWLLGCSKPEPVQDPLDYLRLGVDPQQEADIIIEELRDQGYKIGRRIDERHYVAFDGARGQESLVRVVSVRGPGLSLQVPDVRDPNRVAIALAPDPRPDFDRDGQHDIVVAIREQDRTCLAWAQVDQNGFVSEVFRPSAGWGDFPCVLEIDVAWPRLLLEVSVPDAPSPHARVRLPIKAVARSWVLDDSPAASMRWEREIGQREIALKEAETIGDQVAADRLRAELAWIERLRDADEPDAGGVPSTQPMLEAPGDGEETR